MNKGDLDPSSLAASFERVLIDDVNDCASVNRAAEQYRRVILCVLLSILERHDRNGPPHLIDTKIDILSGKDFADDDPKRGRHTVYSWIQGRGLEALAGHAAWLRRTSFFPDSTRAPLVSRIHRVLGEVVAEVEELRKRNGGRLSFMMTSGGQPLEVTDAGDVRLAPGSSGAKPASFGDLFYAKGLAAASAALGDREKLRDAQRMLAEVFDGIRGGRFVTDQQPMDAKNPVRPVPGRMAQGPWMIALGAAALMLQLTAEAQYVEMGLCCMRHILQHHVKRPGVGPEMCSDYDMWEFVDAAGRPFLEDGALRCDPGHAIEFAGLGLKFLRICRQGGFGIGDSNELSSALTGVLQRNFRNGFQGKGICKAYDLIGRRATNTEMPWWSLPETIRAAIEAHSISRSSRSPYAGIAQQCSNAFMAWYIRPDRHLMANQTINEAGQPIAVVPATPDADPGYHTGLSLIDALGLLSPAIGGTCGLD